MKIGLEIHQQLDTKKLFCNCPSMLREEKPDVIIKRKQYAVAGETGKIDAAALHEQEKSKLFIYEAYSDSTCEIELDESPPRSINEEALKIALQIALLLNAKPLKTMQVMRKTVVDGSNTSGFQRTLLLARNGFVDVDGKRIRIATICLEEDAARIIKQTERKVVYRLDRLGIPLVEIATSPEIANAEEAKKVALKLGEILRACKVKRGIGTIRQDLNVSIERGARTEIKGVQEPQLIVKVIENEIKRQQELIKQNKKVLPTVRKAELDGSTTFLRPLPGEARMYPETDLPFVEINNKLLEEGRKTLPKLKEDITNELMKKGLSEEYASILLRENKIQEFEKLLISCKNAQLAAKMLVILPREIASHEKISSEEIEKKLNYELFEEISKRIAKKEIAEGDVKKILTEIAKGKTLEQAISKKISEEEIEKEIKKLLKEKPNLSINAYMGLLVQKYKNEGKEIMKILKKILK